MLQYLSSAQDWLCRTAFITQHQWVLHVRLTKMVRQKFFVAVRYQLSWGRSAGTALKYFCMIYRGGRTYSVPTYILKDNQKQRILPTTLTFLPPHYLGVFACKLLVICKQFVITRQWLPTLRRAWSFFCHRWQHKRDLSNAAKEMF